VRGLLSCRFMPRTLAQLLFVNFSVDMFCSSRRLPAVPCFCAAERHAPSFRISARCAAVPVTRSRKEGAHVDVLSEAVVVLSPVTWDLCLFRCKRWPV